MEFTADNDCHWLARATVIDLEYRHKHWSELGRSLRVGGSRCWHSCGGWARLDSRHGDERNGARCRGWLGFRLASRTDAGSGCCEASFAAQSALSGSKSFNVISRSSPACLALSVQSCCGRLDSRIASQIPSSIRSSPMKRAMSITGQPECARPGSGRARVLVPSAGLVAWNPARRCTRARVR